MCGLVSGDHLPSDIILHQLGSWLQEIASYIGADPKVVNLAILYVNCVLGKTRIKLSQYQLLAGSSFLVAWKVAGGTLTEDEGGDQVAVRKNLNAADLVDWSCDNYSKEEFKLWELLVLTKSKWRNLILGYPIIWSENLDISSVRRLLEQTYVDEDRPLLQMVSPHQLTLAERGFESCEEAGGDDDPEGQRGVSGDGGAAEGPPMVLMDLNLPVCNSSHEDDEISLLLSGDEEEDENGEDARPRGVGDGAGAGQADGEAGEAGEDRGGRLQRAVISEVMSGACEELATIQLDCLDCGKQIEDELGCCRKAGLSVCCCTS